MGALYFYLQLQMSSLGVCVHRRLGHGVRGGGQVVHPVHVWQTARALQILLYDLYKSKKFWAI
jgi:hypothetical protein